MSRPQGGAARTYIAFAIVLILATIAAPAYAGGRRDDTLSKVDKLISDKLYNEAIIALTAFIKKSPERFDDAQRRLQRIVRSRDDYNRTADELLDTLVKEPENDAKILSLIGALEKNDPVPNRSAREFIARTKETALFTYNRAQFERIMAEGRALIDRGAFADAARTYSGGFALYKAEFDAAGYEAPVVARVESGLGTVRSGLVRLDSLFARSEAALKAFEASYASASGPEGLAPASAAFTGLETLFLEFAAERNAVAAAGRGFENQFLLLQAADKTMTDSSFLPFAFRFVLGRKTEIRPEGIMGAMDTLWMAMANRAQSAAAGAADRSYAAALALRDGGDRRGANAAFLTTVSYAELAVRTISLWGAVAGVETSPALTGYGRSIVKVTPPAALRYQALAAVSRRAAASESLAAEFSDLAARSAAVPASYAAGTMGEKDAAAGLAAIRREHVALSARVSAAARTFDDYARTLDALKSDELLGDEALAYAATQRSAISALSDRILSSEVDAAAEQYRISLAEQRKSMDSIDFERGLALLAGSPAAAGAAPLRYPRESVAILSDAEAMAVRIAADVNALSAALRAEPPRLNQDPRLVSLSESLRALSAASDELRAKAAAALADAREKVRQAETFRLEAERRYEEARAALSRQNFDVARERLQRAGERFDASLAIQESAALRADRDRRLDALGREITKTENDVVVRDVRRLITAARQAYFDGAFERAEDALVQAQNRWRTTNVADESEVTYWLTLVRSALSIKTGRTIPPTAPLFAEMSQLLNFARQYFDEGRELLAARRKTEALAKFAESKKKIEEVKIVFPLNQEASLLSLRIEQVQDPDVFNASFRKKISDAQAKAKERPQEAYSELQDLASINPRFPGLQQAIERLEIDLGLRLPPPDRAALARSSQLAEAARRIVDANLRGQFPVALEQLNEALRLNPNNEAAVTLKDRIQTDVGGQAVAVLSNASEKEYQRAVAELQKGNTIVALAIVEQLLTDPRNRNAPRILELQRRIQSRL